MAHIRAEVDESGLSNVSVEGEALELLALLSAICRSLSMDGMPDKLIRKFVQMGIEGKGLEVMERKGGNK